MKQKDKLYLSRTVLVNGEPSLNFMSNYVELTKWINERIAAGDIDIGSITSPVFINTANIAFTTVSSNHFSADLTDLGTAGTYGDSTNIPSVTVDSKGRVSNITLNPISVPTTVGGDLSGTLPNPTVVGIQGKSVPIPVLGFLKYTGTAWIYDSTDYASLSANNVYTGTNTFNNDIGGVKWTIYNATGRIVLDNNLISSNGSGTLSAQIFSGAGTNLTGTATSLNIGGNAATVTNGVYTTGAYANPSWITSLAWSKITGSPSFITSAAISTLTDVTLTSLISGNFLRYNGTAWVNTNLSSGDIPNLDWSKITTGKPTTLTGYGITSADTLFDSKYYLATNPSGYITTSALSPYLTSATAASTYVPLTRTITINGTTLDLSANRSWTVSGSQWTTSTNDIYFLTANTSTGNVYIGNSAPSTTARLYVKGTTSADTSTYSFLVQDSSNTQLMRLDNFGRLIVGNYNSANQYGTSNLSILGVYTIAAYGNNSAIGVGAMFGGAEQFVFEMRSTYVSNSAVGNQVGDINLTTTQGTTNKTTYIKLNPDQTSRSIQLYYPTFYGSTTTSPTAMIDITGGTTTLAPLRIRSGTNLTTPVDGVLEYNGTNLYFTVGSTRKMVTLV